MFECNCTNTGFTGKFCQESKYFFLYINFQIIKKIFNFLLIFFLNYLDINDCLININKFDNLIKNNTNIDNLLNKCQTVDKKATCHDKINGYYCNCSSEYNGTNCEIRKFKKYFYFI